MLGMNVSLSESQDRFLEEILEYYGGDNGDDAANYLDSNDLFPAVTMITDTSSVLAVEGDKHAATPSEEPEVKKRCIVTSHLEASEKNEEYYIRLLKEEEERFHCIKNPTTEQKKQHRADRNKILAAKSRFKRNLKFSELESQVEHLSEENKRKDTLIAEQASKIKALEEELNRLKSNSGHTLNNVANMHFAERRPLSIHRYQNGAQQTPCVMPFGFYEIGSQFVGNKRKRTPQ